jgi:hypothetical protein
MNDSGDGTVYMKRKDVTRTTDGRKGVRDLDLFSSKHVLKPCLERTGGQTGGLAGKQVQRGMRV